MSDFSGPMFNYMRLFYQTYPDLLAKGRPLSGGSDLSAKARVPAIGHAVRDQFAL